MKEREEAEREKEVQEKMRQEAEKIAQLEAEQKKVVVFHEKKNIKWNFMTCSSTKKQHNPYKQLIV